MCGKSPGLEARLAAEILGRGPMTFDRFMERALYDPAGGYYAVSGQRVGRHGDFITNVSMGPVFGKVLAGQILEMWEALGRPADFVLCEQGANDGHLAADILRGLEGSPLAGVRLILIEPVPALRSAQLATLAGANVGWVASPDELPEMCGVHYSNELLDALPVHVLRSNGEGWSELSVAREQDAFVWSEGPLSEDVRPLAESLPARPSGFTTEVCTGYLDLMRRVGDRIRRGFFLAIDYGLTTSDLLAEHRREGTLRCYSQHRQDARPLEAVGQKDITAHVNYSLLTRAAFASGWALGGFADQHHFLVGAATKMLLELDGHPNPAQLRPLTALLHPENMGRQFQAILFSRGIPPPRLSGFQHARQSDSDALTAEPEEYPGNG